MHEETQEDGSLLAASPIPTASPGAQRRVADLYERYHDRVFRAAFRVVGSESDAEDVLQTVFLRLLRQDESTLPDAEAGSYLHRAAVNAAVDLLRRRRAARTDALADREDRLPARTPAPDAGTELAALRERLRDALADLSPRAAEIFALRYFEGLGNREIAAALGTSWGTVAVTLHRTRARLKASLKGELR